MAQVRNVAEVNKLLGRRALYESEKELYHLREKMSRGAKWPVNDNNLTKAAVPTRQVLTSVVEMRYVPDAR